MPRMTPIWPKLTFATALIFTTPAHANEDAPNRLTIGAGTVIASDYEGSNIYGLAPAAGALARLGGHNISWRGTSLSVDLVPEHEDQRVKFILGPFVNVNLDRASAPSDKVVALLRKRKVALEAGGFVGFTKSGVLTSKYDSITVRLSGSYDVGNVHKSFIVTPTAEYLMPLSKKALVGANISADFVGARYARYYFGVGANGSALSGLPVYRPSGGMKSASLGLLGAVSLGHDLRKGFAVGATFNFERLVGDFADSPLVKTRGNANQVIGAFGVGYTF